MKYRYLGKEKRLVFGVYPIVSLADAREGRDRAKKLLAQGNDPSEAKKDGKQEAIRNAENTFKAVALEWHENQLSRWTPHHALNVTRRFDVDIFPYIGNRPIAEIDPPELLDEVLRRIEKRERTGCYGACKADLRAGLPLWHRHRAVASAIRPPI
jgi:integrase